jgi:hypothetical protein
MRFGYRYTEDALYGRQMALWWRARVFIFPQIGVQVPANEADECVMVCLTQSSETGAPHLRSDLFNER